MPPKEASTPVKDNKKLKDLEMLLACIMSTDNTIAVDYDEFMKHNDAPTRGAAQKRVERMSKSLGVTVKAASAMKPAGIMKAASTMKAADGDGNLTATPGGKRKQTARKITTQKNDEDEDDEANADMETPSKKQKQDKDIKGAKVEDEESVDPLLLYR